MAEARIRNLIAAAFDAHVMEEVREVRSFRFTNVRIKRSMDILPGGAVAQRAEMSRTGAYSFGLTWWPGYLLLTGDLGELTLCHYHALPTFAGISWALGVDHDYLMSKTGVRREYDREAQIKHLRDWANQPVIEYLNGTRSVWWRKDSETGEMVKDVRRYSGFRHELQEWRRNVRRFGPDHPEEGYEKPVADPITKRKLERWQLLSDIRRDHKVEEDHIIPDHWMNWAKLWYEADQWGNIQDILTPDGRREILARIEDEHLQSPDKAADLYYGKLGYDDFSTSEKWNERTYWQIAAIQHGVAMIYLQEFPDSEEAARIRREQQVD